VYIIRLHIIAAAHCSEAVSQPSMTVEVVGSVHRPASLDD